MKGFAVSKWLHNRVSFMLFLRRNQISARVFQSQSANLNQALILVESLLKRVLLY